MISEIFLSRNKDISKLFDALKISFIKENSLVALKVHFGEIGNTAYLKPENVKPLIGKLKELKALPFLTDANTLYKGTRADAVNHMLTAYKHGYDLQNVGVPVIIADGLTGKEAIQVSVNLKHFKEVKIAAAACHANSMIVLTHFKGHDLTGFGGALKNVGMGLGSRAGKQMMHADVRPAVKTEKCTACGSCVKWCPTSAIKMVTNKAFIDKSRCIGCGECIASCNFGAIAISWAGSSASVQEKMVEYFYGAWKDKKDKMVFFNFMTDISPNCDCYGWNDPPVTADIGLLASYDPVAIDQASIDLVKDKFRKIYPDIDWSVQLSYAESLGIGNRNYKLTEI
ncbi:MAG: DUF362 domain-containing protein [bacterium]